MESTSALMIPDEAAKNIVKVSRDAVTGQIATAATAAVPEFPFFVAPADCTVVDVYYMPMAVSTPASGSNSQALLVQKYDGAGGAAVSVAGASVANATPTAALQKFSLGTISNASMSKGNVLTFKSTLTGTATLPLGFICVEFTVN